jgi:hypothetical protein
VSIYAGNERIGAVVWLINRRWWVLAAAFVLLLLGMVLYTGDLRSIPGGVVLILLFIAIPGALMARREAPRPPDPS